MATLNKDIFGLTVENHELVKLAYDAYLANSRSSHAKTLKRGEVSGGGKKPWKQKGTGRARFGSTRNPIWRHGGVAFGRTGEENFTKKLSKTAKKVAVRQALSLKNAAKAIVTIETFACPKGKTKETIDMLKANKISDKENVLLVVSEKDELVIRATRNVANLKVVRPTYLNVFDIMNADKIVITDKAMPMIKDWLMGEEK
ncbi:MAG: 50S ribosomal protein L4 [Candidatus Saccharibacteria bacterium]|nr:50S ribosomal protein L4 [Candidatus Saccharibacteria bacterium]